MTPQPRLTTRSIDDVLAMLPEPTPLQLQGSERFALYVGALGFEERCLSIPRALAASGARCGQAVFLEYDTNSPENEANRLGLETSLAACSDGVAGLGPGVRSFAKELHDVLATLPISDEPTNVLLDVSVASSQFIMTAMRLLLDPAANVRLTIGYTEAKQYFPTRREYELNAEDWSHGQSGALEAGVGDIDRMVEYPGYFVGTLPDAVIVLAGFGRDRARAAISYVNPTFLSQGSDRLHWLVGKPLHEEDAWRYEAAAAIHGVNPALATPVDTFDYRSTIRALDGLYARLGRTQHVTLVPLGSKMQAVGAALYCLSRPEIRVVSATPAHYRGTHYSLGAHAMWEVTLPSVQEVLALLHSVGRLSFA